MIKGLIILTLVVLITSCATPTHYHRESRFLGYSDTKMSDTRYEIVFKANDITGLERLNDYVLLRAAQITVKNDFTYFSLLSTQYSNELKKAPGFRAHSSGLDYAPTIYIKNDSGAPQTANPNKTTQSNVQSINHNATNSLRHNSVESRLPKLKDINSPHSPDIENLRFSSTINKSIIKLSNSRRSTDIKHYRAADIITKITTKYDLEL